MNGAQHRTSACHETDCARKRPWPLKSRRRESLCHRAPAPAPTALHVDAIAVKIWSFNVACVNLHQLFTCAAEFNRSLFIDERSPGAQRGFHMTCTAATVRDAAPAGCPSVAAASTHDFENEGVNANVLPRFLLRIWSLVCEHWFILGVGVAIGLAAAVPDLGKNNGWVHAEYTVKWGAIIIIFFITGITLKTKVLLDASKRLIIHILIQFISLVLTPAIGFGVAKLLSLSSVNTDLIQGLIITMCMPTTISSNVVFTKLAGGNEAVAVVNAVIGNLIGIFLSPAWLYLYLGHGGKAPYGVVIRGMALTVMAPLAVGQVIQIAVPRSAEWIAWIQTFLNFGIISNVMILLLVWATFSNTFADRIIVDGGSIVAIIFIELGLYLAFNAMCLLTYFVKPCRALFRLDRADAIAVANCASTKTLALGLPIMSVLFGSNPSAGVLALPLIIYNAMQVLIGSGLVIPMRAWNVRGDTELAKSTREDYALSDVDNTLDAGVCVAPIVNFDETEDRDGNKVDKSVGLGSQVFEFREQVQAADRL